MSRLYFLGCSNPLCKGFKDNERCLTQETSKYLLNVLQFNCNYMSHYSPIAGIGTTSLTVALLYFCLKTSGKEANRPHLLNFKNILPNLFISAGAGMKRAKYKLHIHLQRGRLLCGVSAASNVTIDIR